MGTPRHSPLALPPGIAGWRRLRASPLSVTVGPLQLAASGQAISGAAGTGKPIANSTASSPLATWASRRPSRLRAYRPWLRTSLLVPSAPQLSVLERLTFLQHH